MNRDLKTVVAFSAARGPADVRAAAERLLKRPRSIPKAGPSRRDDRKRKAAAHAEETSAIRQKVFTRASVTGIPLCELCPDGRRVLARVLAHLESGIGRRRPLQGVHNAAASCEACNDLWDDDPSMRLEMATLWSQRTGWSVPEGVRQAAALKGWTT